MFHAIRSSYLHLSLCFSTLSVHPSSSYFDTCFAPQRRANMCKCSSFIWPHGSAPAALASLPFDPPEPQIIGKTQCFIGKTQCFATLLPFRALHLLSSHSFSSLIFSLLLFSSLTLPTSSFPSVHIVGSLTSKLPSTISYTYTTCLVCCCLSVHTSWKAALQIKHITRTAAWSRVAKLRCGRRHLQDAALHALAIVGYSMENYIITFFIFFQKRNVLLAHRCKIHWGAMSI